MDELTQVKDGARAAWGAGDFTRFAGMLWESGGALVRRLAIGPGDVVLDVGCGTGNLAIQAAEAGAAVTGLDIAPEMLAAARSAGEAAGVEVRWIEGDAEDLPSVPGSVDVVMSSFGCMFAPRHAVAARELARVLRPGGRMGLLTWPIDSDVAEFLRMTSAHLPPPPAIVEPAILWGDEGHVHQIFEGTGLALTVETGSIDFTFASVEAAVDVYTTEFGPLVAARPMLEANGRWRGLVAEIDAFFGRRAADDGRVVMTSAYTTVLGRAQG